MRSACGILRAEINVALGRADGDRRDRHPLDQDERVALHDHAIGEGARVALVGVANDVFLLCASTSSMVFHLSPRENPHRRVRAARKRYFLARFAAPDIVERALESAIAAVREIIVERYGSVIPTRAKVSRSWFFRVWNFIGRPEGQRMIFAVEKVRRRTTKRRLTLPPDRTRAAAIGVLDFDHRFEPVRPARAVANQPQIDAAPPRLGRIVSRRVRAEREGAGIARDVDGRAHRSLEPRQGVVESLGGNAADQLTIDHDRREQAQLPRQ